MQGRIRKFIASHNQKHGSTVLLTSHYMADVTALCKRVIVIHHGSVLYDGELTGLSDRIAPFKLVEIAVEDAESAERAGKYAEGIKTDGNKGTRPVPRNEASAKV